MTDRYSAFVVVLDHDVRADEADATITALEQIRGVISVEPHVGNIEQSIAQVRADTAWRNAIIDFLHEREARQ